eukprot:gb/GEZN01011095.1/.p1 GENE.gb/GEZN01011095.1/~~gb/GEZN01011095.1/.p1  ORF type:complete len:321 (-),score=26.76 gb/GEZN01011095.1/:129-1091(-)
MFGAIYKHFMYSWGRFGKDGVSQAVIITPKRYLKISGELLFLTFMFAWLITLGTKPEGTSGDTTFYTDNVVRDRIGYNNICVGFDFYPANMVTACGFMVSVYFAVRFLFLDSERAFLEKNHGDISHNQFLITCAANLIYALALLQVIFLVMVPPTLNPWWHLITFNNVIWGRWICILAQFYEAKIVAPKEKVFIVVYTFVSMILPILYILDFALYKPGKVALPPILLQVVDLTWFGCLGATTHFLPTAPDIRVSYKLVPHYPDAGRVVPDDEAVMVDDTHPVAGNASDGSSSEPIRQPTFTSSLEDNAVVVAIDERADSV